MYLKIGYDGRIMVETGPSVTEVLAERAACRRPWYNRGDNFKVGLVIEGGAMRGVISGGMALGIGALGLIEAFDAIYGASAGSCAGAYLLSRQTKAVSIFWEDLCDRRFIDLSRPLAGLPIVDIPYLAYTVMRKIKPLEWEKVADSPIPLHAFVSSATDARAIDFCSFETQEEVLDVLHWSCRLPLLAGMPIRVGNYHYTDGGVATGGVTVEAALADGCTHLLVLMSGGEELASNPAASWIGFLMLKKEFPRLAAALLELEKRRRVVTEMIRNSGNITAIKADPGQTRGISSLENNRRKLARGANEGYKAVVKHFSQAG